MPQFDTSNFLPQMFWLAVAFAVLYFGVVRLTLPKIGRVVEERSRVIGADLGAAETARGEAASVGEIYDAALSKARSEAMGVVGDAKAASARETEARLAVINAEIDATLHAAEVRIEGARGAALRQLDEIAADATADIVERLTGRRPSAADARAAVAAAAA